MAQSGCGNENLKTRLLKSPTYEIGENLQVNWDKQTHQDEVRLVGGEHEDGHMLLGQRGDDRLGDLGDAHGLGAAGGVAVGDDVEGEPDGALHLEVL